MLTEDRKKWLIPLLAAILAVGVFASAAGSIYAAVAVKELQAMANDEDVAQEDDVIILDEYVIRSTKKISDAYKSGSTAGLSEKEQETLTMASAVLDEIIDQDMTDYEKEKAVYDWMTTKLSYDTGALQVVPQAEADCDNPYGVLKYHNAVCVGYATTFRLFMQMMDIECMVVHNTDRYHSWDLVKLDDDWYHVDIYSDQGRASYANFNMNDLLASQNHDWNADFFPAANGIEYNYAYQNGQVLEDIYQVPAMIRQGLEEQTSVLALSLESINEHQIQIVEFMLQEVLDRMMDSAEFESLWMEWCWLPFSNREYVLYVTITGYEWEDEPEYDISVGEQEKIDKALAAFDDLSEGDWDFDEDAEADESFFGDL